jgi:prefoldin subunit 5
VTEALESLRHRIDELEVAKKAADKEITELNNTLRCEIEAA